MTPGREKLINSLAESHIKVSVLMITFNHEEFIAQALDTVLMQDVEFSYEILIGDDCSEDRTRNILYEYHKNHPDRIRLLLQDKNLGNYGKNNFAETYKACQGEYIAILEGDDYWTDPRKLQKQVNFLDSHPDCTLCFHNVEVVFEEAGRSSHPASEGFKKSFFILEDLLSGNFIHTCSTMFRAGVLGEIPEWFYLVAMGDWPLFILNALHGYIGYIDEILAAHRIHGGGVWSSASRVSILNRSIDTAEVMQNHLNLNAKPKKILHETIAGWHRLAAEILYKEQDLRGAIHHAKKCLAIYLLKTDISLNLLFKGALKNYFPKLFTFFRQT